MNKVILSGRLGQNPELRYTKGETPVPVVNFSIATNSYFKDNTGKTQERTEWHRVVVFGKQAENCNTYLSKGSKVLVEGSLFTQIWVDNNNVEHRQVQVQAQLIEFLDKKE